MHDVVTSETSKRRIDDDFRTTIFYGPLSFLGVVSAHHSTTRYEHDRLQSRFLVF